MEFVFGDDSFSVPYVAGTNVFAAFKGQKIPKEAVGYRIGDEVRDLQMEIPASLDKPGVRAEFIGIKTPTGVDIIRHTAAHVLAHAVKRLFPNVQVTIGPVIENGFFYDFSKEGGFKEEDLGPIELEMKRIIKARMPIKREMWSVEKAVAFFKEQKEIYKCEIIEDLARKEGVKEVSVYWHGDEFVDLCRGPHVPTTANIPAIKLTHVAGAYWRGDENNEMLSRIYGTAFASEEDLQAYLNMLEEAKRRDHRRIGTDQKLFSFHPEAPASPFFHPNGAFPLRADSRFLTRFKSRQWLSRRHQPARVVARTLEDFGSLRQLP